MRKLILLISCIAIYLCCSGQDQLRTLALPTVKWIFPLPSPDSIIDERQYLLVKNALKKNVNIEYGFREIRSARKQPSICLLIKDGVILLTYSTDTVGVNGFILGVVPFDSASFSTTERAYEFYKSEFVKQVERHNTKIILSMHEVENIDGLPFQRIYIVYQRDDYARRSGRIYWYLRRHGSLLISYQVNFEKDEEADRYLVSFRNSRFNDAFR